MTLLEQFERAHELTKHIMEFVNALDVLNPSYRCPVAGDPLSWVKAIRTDRAKRSTDIHVRTLGDWEKLQLDKIGSPVIQILFRQYGEATERLDQFFK